MIEQHSGIAQALHCQRHHFSIPNQVSYLNCAYMAPLPKTVEQAGVRGVQSKSRPYQIVADDFFQPLEKLKEQFSVLIDNDDAQRIVFQPSVSYGIATVIKNLPLKKGGNIVLIRDQFPSNVLAYQDHADRHQLEIRFVDPPSDFSNRSSAWNERILDAIDHQTICVSCPHNHWADGTIFDLEAIRKISMEKDALLIVDGTQSIGALPFSVRNIQPDALICAGYKFLLGPYSSAISYFGPRFDGGSPLEYNWIARKNSDQFGGLVHYEQEYRTKAYRYNVGECSNFIAVPMLLASIELILQWSVESIQHYCDTLVQSPISELRAMGFKISQQGRASHLFGIYLPADISIDAVQDRLQRANVFVSVRGSSIRVSPHVYNAPSDLQNLIDCLRS